MTPKFSSRGKSVFSAFYKTWRETIFPPFCISCKELSEMKFFCSDCWMLCASPDPIGKCPHCFEDSEGLCYRCRRSPLLSFPQAYVFEDTEPSRLLVRQSSEIIAAFAMYSWIGLDWEVPDVIIPMPGISAVARPFSEMLGKPLAHLFAGNQDGRCDAEAIDVDRIILILNGESSLSECKQAIQSLSVAIPKRGYLLSLFQVEE